jgi:hypothetical protein
MEHLGAAMEQLMEHLWSSYGALRSTGAAMEHLEVPGQFVRKLFRTKGRFVRKPFRPGSIRT